MTMHIKRFSEMGFVNENSMNDDDYQLRKLTEKVFNAMRWEGLGKYVEMDADPIERADNIAYICSLRDYIEADNDGKSVGRIWFKEGVEVDDPEDDEIVLVCRDIVVGRGIECENGLTADLVIEFSQKDDVPDGFEGNPVWMFYCAGNDEWNGEYGKITKAFIKSSPDSIISRVICSATPAYNPNTKYSKSLLPKRGLRESRDDGRYCYFSEKSITREVYVPETFGDEFKSQFDDMDNRQLYDAVKELYDFVAGDPMPNKYDRDELLSWIYEYALDMVSHPND